MRTRGYIALLLAIICAFSTMLCFSGCQNTQNEAAPTQDVDLISPSDTATVQPVETEAPTEADEYEFELDYHRASPIMYSVLGENVINAVHVIVDAFMAGETSADLSEYCLQEDFNDRLTIALNSLLPPFVAFTDYTVGKGVDENGVLSWNLFIERDLLEGKLSTFESSVKKYMKNIEAEDHEAVRAILIYDKLASYSSYDYYLEDLELRGKQNSPEYVRRVSGYNAITRNLGICFSYSYALTFLYVQAGLDCIPVWSDASSVGYGTHGWVAVKLFDQFVYCDPTWDLGKGFSYFGISAFERQSNFGGGYLPEVCYIISSDTCVGDYFEVSGDSALFDSVQNSSNRPVIKVDRENGIVSFIPLSGLPTNFNYMQIDGE